jgi:ABC-type sugar transport system ATPase subunit
MRELAFNVERLQAPAETLSGGNQQKLVIGKWLYRRPKVLLLDEPTQGIDVGAKAEIFNVIADLANRGTAVIFVSSEFEEVVDIADRILVIGRGRALALLERADASVKSILDILFAVGIAA